MLTKEKLMEITIETLDNDSDIGNGQAHQFYIQDKMGALNCMHDQQIVMVRKEKTMSEEFMNPPENDGEYAVRRLLPCECAALQGFPKDWCDDIPHSDSAEYKLWGNGIALPSILGIMQNAVKVIKSTK